MFRLLIVCLKKLRRLLSLWLDLLGYVSMLQGSS